MPFYQLSDASFFLVNFFFSLGTGVALILSVYLGINTYQSTKRVDVVG